MVDGEELIRRAADLVPVLRERAALTEELRQIPQETVDDFHASGILRAAQPTSFGGYDIDYPVVLDIAAELGRRAAPRLGVTAFGLPTIGPRACSRKRRSRSIAPNRWMCCRPRP